MRENKHSKKLAFAVLAAVTAVGANVNQLLVYPQLLLLVRHQLILLMV